MCGIAAIFGTNESKLLDIKSMISSISHRGPDNQGFLNTENISLGSCRLSIFDLSENGNMPMSNKTGRYNIIYNGEIYNFKELKKKYNITTKSNTDTEVLIELFSKLGVNCFKLLNGIFAFIIFDNLEKKVYCVRDRLGVKPLYYLKNNNKYYFCSEIKGILKVVKNVHIDFDTIKFYLNTTFYDTSKNTFYKNISQVEQATCLIFDLKTQDIVNKKYWDLDDKENPHENFDFLDKHLNNSFSIQQRTDTKIGLNLSSGLDSNLMISYLNHINGGQKKISANSYFFSDPEFDHRKDLKEMSEHYGWKINEHEIKSQDIVEKFEKVFDHQDEPYPGIVTIAKDILIERSYPADCKVVLEGQGGDEMAAGYKYAFPLYILDLMKKLKIFDTINEIKSFKNNENMDIKAFVHFFKNSLKGYFYGGVSADGTNSSYDNIFKFEKNESSWLYKDIINKLEKNKSYLKKFLYRDIFFCKLSRILRSCDRASMAHGKELRVPLLDHNVVNFFFSLKNNQLIHNGILRDYYRSFALNKFKYNKFIKQKKYYQSDPQTKWLKTSLFSWANDMLSSKNLYIDQLVNKKKLADYLQKFRKDEGIKNSNLIWQLISIEYLLKKHKGI